MTVFLSAVPGAPELHLEPLNCTTIVARWQLGTRNSASVQGYRLFYHEESQPESAPVQLRASVKTHTIGGLGKFLFKWSLQSLQYMSQSKIGSKSSSNYCQGSSWVINWVISCHVSSSRSLGRGLNSTTSHFHNLQPLCSISVSVSFQQLLDAVVGISQLLWPLGQIHFGFFCSWEEKGPRPVEWTTDHLWPEGVSQVASSCLVNQREGVRKQERKLRRYCKLLKVLKYWAIKTVI